jgi:molecular chaperone GrpE
MKKEKQSKVQEEVLEKEAEMNVEPQEETNQETENQEKAPENNLEADLAEAKDKYLRLYSEFENFRRRTAKERIELLSTANREVIEAVIPVVDDFERAIKAATKTGEDTTGSELIYNKLKGILESKGLKRMEINAGDEFNDEFHEAITQIPAPDATLEGKIVDVIEPGYYLGEKVIRFAKVVTGAKQ